MPTPSSGTLVSPTSPDSQHRDALSARSLCPPEESRISSTSPTAASHVLPGCPVDTRTKAANTSPESPSRDIPTPMTATDDGAEEQRMPISPSVAQRSSPFPSHRVCHASTMSYVALVFTDTDPSFFPIPPLHSFGPGAASRAARPRIASSMKLKWRSSMSTCASRLCADICASKA